MKVRTTEVLCGASYGAENPLSTLWSNQAYATVRIDVNPRFWGQFDSSLRPNLGRSRVATKGLNLSFTKAHNDLLPYRVADGITLVNPD